MEIRPVGAAPIQADACTVRWDVRTDGQDGSTVQCMVFGQRGGSGAGGRAYWVWRNGEGWVFNCLRLQCGKVICTEGGGDD